MNVNLIQSKPNYLKAIGHVHEDVLQQEVTKCAKLETYESIKEVEAIEGF